MENYFIALGLFTLFMSIAYYFFLDRKPKEKGEIHFSYEVMLSYGYDIYYVRAITNDEDYWTSFETKDGTVFDVNIWVEDGEWGDVHLVNVYKLVNQGEDGVWTMDDMVQMDEIIRQFHVEEITIKP